MDTMDKQQLGFKNDAWTIHNCCSGECRGAVLENMKSLKKQFAITLSSFHEIQRMPESLFLKQKIASATSPRHLMRLVAKKEKKYLDNALP